MFQVSIANFLICLDLFPTLICTYLLELNLFFIMCSINLMKKTDTFVFIVAHLDFHSVDSVKQRKSKECKQTSPTVLIKQDVTRQTT